MRRTSRSAVVDRVRLLLDVDGVLNPVGAPCPDWQAWNVAACRGLPITHSLELGRAIAELDVEVIWLSTWRDEANTWIGPLFGWPGHSVIVVDDEDMLSWRSWWKLDAAKKLYAEEPRPFIWADDDLGTMAEAYGWCREVDGLPIVPQTAVGLTRAHLSEMKDYVARSRGSGGGSPGRTTGSGGISTVTGRGPMPLGVVSGHTAAALCVGHVWRLSAHHGH